MRRSDKEITDIEVIKRIMDEASVCHIGLSDNNIPYVIPMNFGYCDNTLYLHSFNEGKKIDIIKKNNNVCFEADIKTELTEAESPCNWSMKYYSVIGFGKAFFIEDINEKSKIMNIIMKKYSGRSNFEFPENSLAKLTVIKIDITRITGKKSKYND